MGPASSLTGLVMLGDAKRKVYVCLVTGCVTCSASAHGSAAGTPRVGTLPSG